MFTDFNEHLIHNIEYKVSVQTDELNKTESQTGEETP